MAYLRSWLETTHNGASFTAGDSGFASISRRRTLTKPLIAAVNGICFGGGTELISNCDIVVAWEGAKFALPEVSRGVMAGEGGIPRVVAAAGHQVSELTAYTHSLVHSLSLSLLPNSYLPVVLSQPEKPRNASACEFKSTTSFCIGIQLHTCSVNKVVPDQRDVLPAALKYAAEIIKNSPDSVRSTKLALLLAKEMGMDESCKMHTETAIAKEVHEGENIKEGLTAFNEVRTRPQSIPNPTTCILQKRKPQWKNPRSLAVPAKL